VFAENRKKQSRHVMTAGSALRAARTSAPRHVWVQQAVLELLQEDGVDRVGVWLEAGQESESTSSWEEGFLEGQVAERTGTSTPPEWRRFSSCAPLPEEVLSCRGSVETASAEGWPQLGPTIELERTLWVPIRGQGQTPGKVLGLILVGQRGAGSQLPHGPAERMAELLGVLLEQERAAQCARERQADLNLWKQVRRSLRERQNPGALLELLAESSTKGTALEMNADSAGAIFTVIVEKKPWVKSESPATPGASAFIHAHGGDSLWTHSVERGLLEKLWRGALETGNRLDADATREDFARLPLTKDISRIVAIPLYWGGEVRGAFLAGLPKRKNAADILQRLETRALMAEQVLEANARLHPFENSGNKYAAEGMAKPSGSELPRTAKDLEAERQQTLDWLEEGVIVFGENEEIRALNTSFLQIIGLTAEEGETLRTLPDILKRVARNAADPEEFAARWIGLASEVEERGKEELAMDWPVPHLIERFAKKLAGENGRPLGRVEVYRPATANKNFQARMVQAEKLAALGQRVSGIVHELSNPLTTILGIARQILSRAGDNASLKETKQILQEAERAAGILRQLLRLSAESRPERRLVSLNELVDQTLLLQRTALGASRIRLQVDQQAGLPRVAGDFNQLQQVLLNLLQNAQQAIEQSGIGNLIGVRTTATNDGRVQLEVWDNGPGIPVAIQARIFDPFFTTKAPGLGTGLGLPIVLGFVKQHGGTVVALSPPKGGSRFVVELFAATEAGTWQEVAPARLADRLPEVPIHIGEFTRNGTVPRVLVLEDEPTVGRLIADVLQEEGMQVDVLQDGYAALHRAEKDTYDLAICDLKMPGMDGQNFFQALVNRQDPLQLRLLFVTGDLISPRTQEFLERYHLPYVAKPFRMEELSGAVHELLRKKRNEVLPRQVIAGNLGLRDR
jgi:signal transduction histidine kinase/ActR/RegA family two-component response regulator